MTRQLGRSKLPSYQAMGARFYPNHRRLLIRLECSTSNAGNPEQLDGFVIAQARTHTQTPAFEHGKRSRVPRIVACEGNQTNDRQKKVKSLGAPMTKSLGCLDGWVFPQLTQIASHLCQNTPELTKGSPRSTLCSMCAQSGTGAQGALSYAALKAQSQNKSWIPSHSIQRQPLRRLKEGGKTAATRGAPFNGTRSSLR